MNPTPPSVGAQLDLTPAMQSRTRFRVLALISVGTMINYLDRTVLGVAAPGMVTDLHLSPAIMGVVFSAFSWSYAVAQIPGGWVLDRIGTRITYFLAVSFWSLFTLAAKRPSRPRSRTSSRPSAGCGPTPRRMASIRNEGWFGVLPPAVTWRLWRPRLAESPSWSHRLPRHPQPPRRGKRPNRRNPTACRDWSPGSVCSIFSRS